MSEREWMWKMYVPAAAISGAFIWLVADATGTWRIVGIVGGILWIGGLVLLDVWLQRRAQREFSPD